jgi:dienelactone hydrolase
MLRSAEKLALRGSGSLQSASGLTAHRAVGGELDYFAYVPRNASSTSPLMVTVHGIERLALQHAVRFSALAETAGFVVLAPLFTKSRMPRYQRAERGPNGDSPIKAFELTVEHFWRTSGLQTEPIRLFGYSGGAQFAMRQVLLGSLPVARLALAAPGWYSMPDEVLEFPYGVAASNASEGRQPELARLLATPTLVLVGGGDTRRDSSLNRQKIVEETQGRTRLERAQRWHTAMGAAADIRGMQRKIELQVLPGAPHDFNENMQSFGLGDFVAKWLIT